MNAPQIALTVFAVTALAGFTVGAIRAFRRTRLTNQAMVALKHMNTLVDYQSYVYELGGGYVDHGFYTTLIRRYGNRYDRLLGRAFALKSS